AASTSMYARRRHPCRRTVAAPDHDLDPCDRPLPGYLKMALFVSVHGYGKTSLTGAMRLRCAGLNAAVACGRDTLQVRPCTLDGDVRVAVRSQPQTTTSTLETGHCLGIRAWRYSYRSTGTERQA